MANLTNIIKINETDYQTLADGGSVVKDGQTYTFDANALYLVPDTSTSVTGEIPNDLGLSSTLLYLENDSGQIGTGINLSTLKTNLGLTNAVTSTSTLTSGRIILGNGSKTIRATSYTIDTTQLSGSTYIPTSYVVENAITNAIDDLSLSINGKLLIVNNDINDLNSSITSITNDVNGLSLSITTTSDGSLGNLKLNNESTGVSLTDINKAVVIELDGTSATSVGNHDIAITKAKYDIIKDNYPNVIIQLRYTPNMTASGTIYYVYLTPKSGIIDKVGILNDIDYIFFGGEVQIGNPTTFTKCDVSLSVSVIGVSSARATLTMSKVQTAKYQHNLRYYNQDSYTSTSTKYSGTYFTATIINNSSAAFTASTLLSYLETNGFTSANKQLSTSGIYRGSSGIAYILLGLTKTLSRNVQIYGIDVSILENSSLPLTPDYINITLTDGTLTDTVVEI